MPSWHAKVSCHRSRAGMKLELESRLFLGVSDSNPLNAFEDDDFVVLRLSYFF